MGKLTFADVIDTEFTIYEVSKGGSISKREGAKISDFRYVFEVEDMYGKPADKSKSTLHINEKGNIHNGWGYGIFLNKEEAQALALKIVNTKHENSLKKIMNI